MKRFLIGFGVIFVILLAGIVALPFLVPKSTYRSLVETQLENALGRDVTLAADPSISLFPQIGVRFDDVTIANAEGFDAPHFAKADSLAVSVKWMPLLSKKVEIASANFIGAEVFLEEDKKGNVNWEFEPKPTKESEAEAKPAGDAAFSAEIPKARLSKSHISYVSKASDLAYDVTDIDLTAGLTGKEGAVSLDGSLAINQQPFKIKATLDSLQKLSTKEPLAIIADIQSSLADAHYDGRVTLADAVLLDGKFSADAKDLAGLAKFANVELEQDLSALGHIVASGQINGTPDDLKVTNLKATQAAKAMNASFEGQVAAAKTVSFTGQFSADVTNPRAIADLAGVELKNDISGLGKLAVRGNVDGVPENIRLSNLSVDQSGSLLTSRFTGSAAVGKTVSGAGKLSLKSPDVKGLAKAFDVELKGADASAYQSLEAELDLTEVKGGFAAAISTLRLDKIEATGNASVITSGNVLFVSAQLSIPRLEMTPYITEDSTGTKKGDPTDGWSTDPIDLSSLKSVNGAFKLAIGYLANDRAELLDVNFDGKLQNGQLSGTLLSSSPDGGRNGTPSKLNPLYNGNLTTNFAIASQTPTANTLSFSAKGSGIAAADLVRFFTGQNVLNGVAGIDTVANTQGSSVADFVHNLTGTYDANVANGAIFGVNLAQLVRSAGEAIKTGKLPEALSPEAQTDFSSLNLKGNLQQGVANIELFNLQSPFVLADATGTIDLFNQTLDIRFRPRAAGSQTGQTSIDNFLNGIGIPLRVTGSWSKISGSLDMNYVSKLAADRAQNKIKDELTKKLGGDLNGALGGALGGLLGTNEKTSAEPETAPTTSSPSDSDTSAATPEETASEAEETPAEQDPEEAAKELLKGLIFGKKK